MGVRQDVKLVYGIKSDVSDQAPVVFIYSHWYDAMTLKAKIKNVLERRERWDDESYLARMIFSNIIQLDDINSATGFGLAPYSMGDHAPVVVDLGGRTVDGVDYESFIQ